MKKADEDLGPNTGFDFLTDDENNEAERNCGGDEYDTDSVETGRSRNMSINSVDVSTLTWPQSYRQSMDMLSSVSMTPPSISFLKAPHMGPSAGTSSTSVIRKRSHHQFLDPESSLEKPFIVDQSSGADDAPVKFLSRISSANEFSSPDNSSSVAQAVLNGINILCGIGLLTMPYAVKEGGWLSLLILCLFGIMCCYTGILLKKCLESSPSLKTYPDIGQAAFGIVGRLVISVVLYIELYASAVEFVIMMGDNLSALFPNAHVEIGGLLSVDSNQCFLILSTFIVLPTVWLRDLSLLGYLSGGGVLTSIMVAICLVWVGVVDKVGFHYSSSGKAIHLTNLPVAIGIYGFGFSGHSVFPNIYSSMTQPSAFPKVLIVSFIFCGILYTGAAVCGYSMFGDSVQSQYTLNMPSQFMASKIAVWTAVVNPMTKYALTIIPVALSLEELMPPGRFRSYWVSIIIRTMLVMSTLVVALTIPFFGFVMALIGSLLAMLVAVIFPCACYLGIYRDKSTKLQVVACVVTMVLGAINGSIGTYSAITRIADKFSPNNNAR